MYILILTIVSAVVNVPLGSLFTVCQVPLIVTAAKNRVGNRGAAEYDRRRRPVITDNLRRTSGT